MNKLFCLVSLCLLCGIRLSVGQDLLATAIDELQNQIERSLTSDEVPDLEEYYADISTAFNFSALFSNLQSGKATVDSCKQCTQFIGLGRSSFINANILVSLAHTICKTANFYSERVCDGTIERLADPIIYIVQHSKLTTEEICSVLINPQCMPLLNYTITTNIEWELPLPPKKAFTSIHTAEMTYNMLHLTDVHLDLWYTEGSNAECGEPLCCRSTSYGNNHSAGYWSETYGDCDTPLPFAVSSIKYIANTHKDLNFVIWTGDSVPHDVWNTTEEVNLLHLNKVTQLVSDAFKGVNVFPCLGNHEAHPINLYVPYVVSQVSNHSMKWLYNTVADSYWSEWLNTTEAKSTFKKGGYYSKMVTPMLKLVALNNNVGYRSNFWIAYDPVDPDGQLAWLIQQLDEAESSGHYVIIIGHIPPGGDYYDAWNHNYIRIVERYSHLITAAYNGHTHKDEIVLLYSRNSSTQSQSQSIPIGVNYVSPSLTTFTRLNPAYRIFSLNQNGQPVDISTYYSDVIESNKNGRTVEPKWRFLYTPKTEYNLTSLSAQSWAKFVSDSADNDVLAQLYYTNYHRISIAYEEDSHYTMKQIHKLINGTKLVDPYVIN